MQPPPPLKRGPKWLQEIINGLITFAVSIQPLESENCAVHDSPVGKQIIPGPPGGSGTAAQYRLFQLVSTTDPAVAAPGNKRIRVTRSTIAGEQPDDWEDSEWNEADDPPYLLEPVGASGYVFAHVVVSQTEGGGEVTAATIEIATEMPEESDTDYYIELGTYTFVDNVITCSNSQYGPVNVTICPNWAAAEAPFYGVTVTGSPA